MLLLDDHPRQERERERGKEREKERERERENISVQTQIFHNINTSVLYIVQFVSYVHTEVTERWRDGDLVHACC